MPREPRMVDHGPPQLRGQHGKNACQLVHGDVAQAGHDERCTGLVDPESEWQSRGTPGRPSPGDVPGLSQGGPSVWSTSFGPPLTGLGESEFEHRNLAGFEMRRQLEALGKQRLHHEPHLVFCRIGRCCARLDAATDRPKPTWAI